MLYRERSASSTCLDVCRPNIPYQHDKPDDVGVAAYFRREGEAADEEAIAAPPASSTNDLDEEPHEILEISPDASDDAVKAAARRLSANVHPDTEEFQRIQKAKDAVLED